MDFWGVFSYATLGTVIEFAKLMPIMIFILGFKLRSPKRIAAFGAGAVAVLIIFAALSLKLELIRDMPIEMFVSVLLTIFIIRGNHRILYTIIADMGINILDMFFTAFWLMFIKDMSFLELAYDPVYNIIANSFNIVTILVVSCIVKSILSKQKYIDIQSTKKTYLVLILLGEISLLMYVSAFLYDSEKDSIRKVMSLSLTAGNIIFLLTAIILLADNISKNRFKKISEMNEKLVESQARYYEMLLNKEEETRKFRHDINNHLNCMRLLFKDKKYDELGEYFDKMGAAVLELRPELQLGNDLISAILKDEKDKYPDVMVEIVGKMPSVIRLDNTDICTIFYNLFNNAFAAAENSEKKEVEISVKTLGNYLYVTVKNSVDHKVEIADNVLTTDKQDKTIHGFGTKNSVICAEKNGGTLSYKCSDTYFEAELILPDAD